MLVVAFLLPSHIALKFEDEVPTVALSFPAFKESSKKALDPIANATMRDVVVSVTESTLVLPINK